MVTMVKTPRLEELDVLELLLTEKITVKEPPKVALSRVQFTKFLVESYGISEEKGDPMSVKNLAGFGVNAVQHQAWVNILPNAQHYEDYWLKLEK